MKIYQGIYTYIKFETYPLLQVGSGRQKNHRILTPDSMVTKN